MLARSADGDFLRVPPPSITNEGASTKQVHLETGPVLADEAPGTQLLRRGRKLEPRAAGSTGSVLLDLRPFLRFSSDLFQRFPPIYLR